MNMIEQLMHIRPKGDDSESDYLPNDSNSGCFSGCFSTLLMFVILVISVVIVIVSFLI